ncbi:glycine-rich domain-containing protein [Vogesella mureinivorans]|uniref:glycine-rich domain-containing protein n=1 Tax=Vogesella mureinivorans TaxID=657276 RepID=UPI0011CAD330|nr:hypothetical protein [Vogesella mureinivorans]
MQHKMPPVATADGMFHDGNPATGEPGTIVSALWLNALQSATRNVQAELLSVLEAAGVEADPDEINQLEAAIKQLAWGALQRPSTVSGYGITDALRGQVQHITATGQFVVPAGVHRVCVTLAGGGGGGAGAIMGTPYLPAGGGAGQVKYREFLDVVPGQRITVTVGTGGQEGIGSASGGNYTNSNGMPGGVSSFGALLSAAGGAGGACQPSHSYGGAAGGGPFAERGADGDVSTAQTLGAVGGGNILAPAMHASYHASGTALGYGAGGCGGRAAGYWQNGAAGGAGVCIVEW